MLSASIVWGKKTMRHPELSRIWQLAGRKNKVGVLSPKNSFSTHF